jgi:hypothetical protein
MRALYFDCFAGISGDMIVGALLDLGLSFDALCEGIASVGIAGYSLEASRVVRSHISAVKFDVKLDARPQPPRALEDIRRIIGDSNLSDPVKLRSIEVFQRLAAAEARAHGLRIEEVHLHEVGALDSIIDVVGAMIGFEQLGIERFFSSPVRTGFGLVETEHGLLPIPAPGTAELLRGAAAYGGDLEGEFTTPTGAAILATLCESFAPMPAMKIIRVGYGAGSRDVPGLPNVLRLVLGELGKGVSQEVAIVETNIDDMNPQIYERVFERALELGALDVFLAPVQMKKGRPGILLTLICEPSDLDQICGLLLEETSTLGVRHYMARRKVLDRELREVDTPYGRVRVKVALLGGRELHFQPEYEDCAALARQAGVPLLEVQMAAIAAYRNKQDG